MKTKDLMILQELRTNARRSLTDISQSTNIPLSTIFKKVEKLEKECITKYVSLIDFKSTGFGVRINLVLKAKERTALKRFLLEHPNINSLYRVSQGFDFLIETVFPSMLEFEDFMEELNDLVSDKKVFHVIEDLRREDFMLVENEQVK